MKFASLTVWNMKTWKPMTVLPLGEDPPAITSLSFNHNGKILAAAATDGMIHMFDMSAGLQITGWPAHDCAISSVLFGRDETSIFSLGSDGKIFEWSLRLCLETQKTGERKGILWTGPLNISPPVIWLQRGKQGMERNPFPTERKGIESFPHPRPSENLAKEWGDPLLCGKRNWWERGNRWWERESTGFFSRNLSSVL